MMSIRNVQVRVLADSATARTAASLSVLMADMLPIAELVMKLFTKSARVTKGEGGTPTVIFVMALAMFDAVVGVMVPVEVLMFAPEISAASTCGEGVLGLTR